MMGRPTILSLIRSHVPRLSAFVVVGMVNTVFGYAVYLAGLWFGMRAILALAAATATGAVFNYFTIGRLVFGERRVHLLPRFLMVYAALYTFNAGLIEGIMAVGAPAWLAQGLSLPIVVAASYTLMNLVVFRGHGPAR